MLYFAYLKTLLVLGNHDTTYNTRFRWGFSGYLKDYRQLRYDNLLSAKNTKSDKSLRL